MKNPIYQIWVCCNFQLQKIIELCVNIALFCLKGNQISWTWLSDRYWKLYLCLHSNFLKSLFTKCLVIMLKFLLCILSFCSGLFLRQKTSNWACSFKRTEKLQEQWRGYRWMQLYLRTKLNVNVSNLYRTIGKFRNLFSKILNVFNTW